jgi:hypothetical protein
MLAGLADPRGVAGTDACHGGNLARGIGAALSVLRWASADAAGLGFPTT